MTQNRNVGPGVKTNHWLERLLAKLAQAGFRSKAAVLQLATAHKEAPWCQRLPRKCKRNIILKFELIERPAPPPSSYKAVEQSLVAAVFAKRIYLLFLCF